MDLICLDTNILIAHKRAKAADKDKTILYRFTVQGYHFAVSSITVYELLRGDNTDEDRYWKTMFGNMKRLNMDSSQFAALCNQQFQEGSEQAFTPDAGIVNELKKA